MSHKHIGQWIVLVVGCLAAPGVAWTDSLPEVTNVTASQRPGTYLVDISYDLFDADDDVMIVTAHLSVDGGVSYPIPCVSVVGDVGPDIVSGTGLSMVWDAGVDHPDFSGPQCAIRVVAEDGSLSIPEGFVLIRAGSFEMGSLASEADRDQDETRHSVALTRDFFMQAREVTQAEYQALMFTNPSYHSFGPDYPVEQVDWNQAIEYCNAKSAQDGLTPAYDAGHGWNQQASGWRLPTEAEWEYACRAATDTRYWPGDADSTLDPVGWYSLNSAGITHPAGGLQASPWGLYDMHGNVWEWCWDWYGPYGEDAADPVGPASGTARVLRGGAMDRAAHYCRSANRTSRDPLSPHIASGFRVVRWVE